MPNKIFIEDLLFKLKGDKESEIDFHQRIRFEIGENKFTVGIVNDKLKIYKRNDIGEEDISIQPYASNVIFVK